MLVFPWLAATLVLVVGMILAFNAVHAPYRAYRRERVHFVWPHVTLLLILIGVTFVVLIGAAAAVRFGGLG